MSPIKIPRYRDNKKTVFVLTEASKNLNEWPQLRSIIMQQDGVPFCGIPAFQNTRALDEYPFWMIVEVDETDVVKLDNPNIYYSRGEVLYINDRIRVQLYMSDLVYSHIRSGCQHKFLEPSELDIYDLVTFREHAQKTNNKAFGLSQCLGIHSQVLQSGECGVAKLDGDCGQAMQLGNNGAALVRGDNGLAAQSGRDGIAYQIGYDGLAAQLGDDGYCVQDAPHGGVAAQRGERGQAISKSCSGIAAQSGGDGFAMQEGLGGVAVHVGTDGAAVHDGLRGIALCCGGGNAETKGGNSIAIAVGFDGRAKGKKGDTLILIQHLPNFFANVKVLHVGEDGIEPDTWYSLRD